MSDQPQGQHWWQANDGKWYPPSPAPEHQSLPDPPTPPATGWWMASDGEWYPPHLSDATSQHELSPPQQRNDGARPKLFPVLLGGAILLLVAVVAGVWIATDREETLDDFTEEELAETPLRELRCIELRSGVPLEETTAWGSYLAYVEQTMEDPETYAAMGLSAPSYAEQASLIADQVAEFCPDQLTENSGLRAFLRRYDIDPDAVAGS